METFELRYFMAAARHENIRRAAEELNISPGSVSKAVARLEEELGVSLFARAGRAIRLTEEGLFLQDRARRLLALEEACRAEIRGGTGTFPMRIAGPEALLSLFGGAVATRLRELLEGVRTEFLVTPHEDAARTLLESGKAQLALFTSAPPDGFDTRLVGKTSFKTFAGLGHPLLAAQCRNDGSDKKGKETKDGVFPIEQVLRHGFVCPTAGILGAVPGRASADGWRDDHFPRRVSFVAPTLALLRDTLESGAALAYLPEGLGLRFGATPLKVTGCPYTCRQDVTLVALRAHETGWGEKLFRS